jgi:steroid 5-alpha reductase family enzyme
VVIVLMVGCWLASLRLRDVSIVDILWAPAFFVVGATCLVIAPHPVARGWVALCLILFWSFRLGGHIYRRWRRLGHEDYRYAEIRRRNEPNFPLKSLIYVFGFQGLLLWIISWPLQAAIASTGGLKLLDIVGIATMGAGIALEAVADAQLTRFRADPANKDAVLKTGVWSWSRHPNYFGDFMLWWGVFVLAIAGDGPWWTILGPIVMSALLMRFSGVGLLEKTIGSRRPDYSDYVQRTSSFFPWPPGRTGR